LLDHRGILDVELGAAVYAHIAERKRRRQRQRTWAGHDEYRGKHVKGGVCISENPIAKTRKGKPAELG
jgi:hypothetical protein